MRRSQRVLLVCLALCAAVAAQQGEQTTSAVSEDGTQRGAISLSDDGTSGSVSSSSRGRHRASSSASLTVGGGESEGSFSAQGDTQGVSDTLSTGTQPGGQQESFEDTFTPPEEFPSFTFPPIPPIETPPMDMPFSTEGAGEGRQEPPFFPSFGDEGSEPFSFGGFGGGFPGFQSSYSTSMGSTDGGSYTRTQVRSSQEPSPKPKKICLVSDSSEFDRKYAEGYEVTLVKKHDHDSVEIVRAVQRGGSSSRSSIVTSRIPDDVKKQCGITEADLGVQPRGSYDYSGSSSSSASSSSGESHAASASRAMWLKLCEKESFKRLTKLQERCKEILSGGGGQDEFGTHFVDSKLG